MCRFLILGKDYNIYATALYLHKPQTCFLMYQCHSTPINRPFTAKPYVRYCIALDTLPPYLYYELLVSATFVALHTRTHGTHTTHTHTYYTRTRTHAHTYTHTCAQIWIPGCTSNAQVLLIEEVLDVEIHLLPVNK